MFSGFTVWIVKIAESMLKYFEFKKDMNKTVSRATMV